MQNTINTEKDGKPQTGIFGLIGFCVSILILFIVYVFLEVIYLREYPWFRTVKDFDLWKLIVFGLPVIYYLKCCNRVSLMTFLKLDSITKEGIISIIAVVSFTVLFRLIIYQPTQFDPFFSMSNWVRVVIMASFTEEVVFRGVILQKAKGFMSFWRANFVSAMLFMLIHAPAEIYFLIHYLAFGLALGYVFKVSNSLWGSILFHATSNFLILALR